MTEQIACTHGGSRYATAQASASASAAGVTASSRRTRSLPANETSTGLHRASRAKPASISCAIHGAT